MRRRIQHQRIHPGCPLVNGAHARMHRKLKRGAIRPLRATPAARYQPSPRPFPARLTPLEYPGHVLLKNITMRGMFRSGPTLLYVVNALAHHRVGREETDDGKWSLVFHTVLLAKFYERDLVLHD
jgi:putative transposase